MNTLVRNATTTLSRRLNGYEPLNLNQYADEVISQPNISRKTPNSKSRNANPANFGYRIARSKQRMIFLQSYTLASKSRLKRASKSGKMRMAAVKARRVVVSLVAFLRFGGSRNCGSGSVICASSPPRRDSRFS